MDEITKADDHEGVGQTLIHCAESGDLGQIRAIEQIEKWVNWTSPSNRVDTFSESALVKAARAGHADVVSYLLNHGADVDAKSQALNNSVLMVACYNGHVEIAKELLDRGASYAHLSDEKASALSHGARFLEITKLLLARGARSMLCERGVVSPLHQALNLKVPCVFEERMDYALLPERREVVRVLLAEGADPDAESTFTSGLTPLMSAAYLGCAEIYHQLLRAGANPHARDPQGRTAADYYARHLSEVRGPKRYVGEPPEVWSGGVTEPLMQ